MVTKPPEIKRNHKQVHRMFYLGETVRSQYHGLGEVTSTGGHPRVRFLDGHECFVLGDTLRFVPWDVFDAEVRNQMMIEQYLTLRVYGSAPSDPISLPRPEFDLMAAMMRDAQSPLLPVGN